MLYVAYGSNMDKTQMELRCPGAICLGPCEITNHTLEFRIYANIKYKKGGYTPATAWIINKSHLKSLDMYEGVHRELYKHKKVKVLLNGELITMMAYIMVKGSRKKHKPSLVYLNTICKGYTQVGHDMMGLKKYLPQL